MKNTLTNYFKEAQRRLAENKHTKEIYQARWVWYHTILVAQQMIVIFLLIGILIKL
jgi:hypothetical protein